MLKIGLRKYSYRGEFYKCSLKILNQTVKDVINFLNKYNKECNIKKEHIVKFNHNRAILSNNKIQSKKNSKTLSKKTSKTPSKKHRIKTSKK
jgi:autotransporter adhesin